MAPQWGPIVQNAYLVDDIPAAAQQWAATIGVSPFLYLETVECEAVSYRGKSVEFPLSTAVAYSGSLQIELLLMRQEEAARFPEFFRTGVGKLHHYQVRTTDLEGLLKARNLEEKVLLRANAVAGMKICFVDLGLPDGALLEITEATPELLGFMEGFRAVAGSWSGEQTIITSDELVARLQAAAG